MENDIFDKELLGFKLRQARIKAGYEKAEDFASALEQRVGYSVSRQTIYNIESGKQEPRLSLYLAMRRLLYPDEIPATDAMLNDCLPPRWRMPLSVMEEMQQGMNAQIDAEDSVLDSLAASYSDTVNALATTTIAALANSTDLSHALESVQKTLATLTAPASKLISQSVSQSFGTVLQSGLAPSLESLNSAKWSKQTLPNTDSFNSTISDQPADRAPDSEGKAARP